MKNNRFLMVGLTGSIGSGKSTVRKMLEHMGAFTLDADSISREVTAPGSDALKEISATWGKEILKPDGSLDRRKLAMVTFSDREELEKLNRIIHPPVIERENRLFDDIKKTALHGIIVLEASLMIETNSYKRFDRIVVVTADEKSRRERLEHGRGLDKKLFDAISENQMPDIEKLKYADYHIENDGTEAELFQKTRWLYLKLAEELEKKIEENNV